MFCTIQTVQVYLVSFGAIRVLNNISYDQPLAALLPPSQTWKGHQGRASIDRVHVAARNEMKGFGPNQSLDGQLIAHPTKIPKNKYAVKGTVNDTTWTVFVPVSS